MKLCIRIMLESKKWLWRNQYFTFYLHILITKFIISVIFFPHKYKWFLDEGMVNSQYFTWNHLLVKINCGLYINCTLTLMDHIHLLFKLCLKWSEVKWSEVKSLSCVWLFATPWTVAYQAAPSMGFSRQEYWSGLPFPA